MKIAITGMVGCLASLALLAPAASGVTTAPAHAYELAADDPIVCAWNPASGTYVCVNQPT